VEYEFNLNNKFQIKYCNIILFIILIFLVTIIFSGSVSAASLATSPQPKFHHDNNNTGQSQYKGPQTNTTKWKHAADGGIFSSPAIGNDGTIYYGSLDKKFYALTPNGTEKWSFDCGSVIGISPAIDEDGIIYFASDSRIFYALYPNGTEKWEYTPINGNLITTSPAIANDGTIYFSTANSVWNYHNNSLCALNPDGTLKWNFHIEGISLSNPAIGNDGTIYFGDNNNYLYAVNPDGTEYWNFTSPNMIVSSPAIGSDGIICFGCEDHYVYALNPNGTLKWKYQTGNVIDSSPSIANDGTIYILSGDGFLYALNHDGTLKWKYSIYNGDYTFISSPSIGNDDIIYVGSGNSLYAVNPNGTLKWKYQTGNIIESSPAIGSDGTLYFGSEDKYFYAIQDDKTPPTASATPTGSLYNTTITVKLSMTKTGTIYYTLNGTTPTSSSNKYSGPITIKQTTTMKYLAVDLFGNKSPVYTKIYTIDNIIPRIISTIPASNSKGVSLTSPVTFKFSEKIKAGKSFSNIYIKNLTTGKITHISTTISGNTLTIKMIKSRLSLNSYQVYIPANAVKDNAGNNNKQYILTFKTSKF
jgi:outer membrane protein assembly factor BamB